jgi:CelD/BcsL family acetyltransferase involved in cellulose biosynthesis
MRGLERRNFDRAMSLDAASPAVPRTAATVPLIASAAVDDVLVYRTLEEVEALRDSWRGFSHPDADLEIFLTVIRERPEMLRPHVIAVQRDGRPAALLAARLEDCELPAKFGYATLYRPRLRRITVVTGGVVSAAEDCGALAEALLAALARGEADAVELQRIPVTSPLRQALLERSPAVLRQPFVGTTPHHAMDLPDGAAAVLPALSKSVRDNLKRYSRRLEREYGARVTVRQFDAPTDFEDAVRDLETVAAATYQRGLGAGFRAETDATLTRIALEGGWFRAWVLYLDGTPCAFEIGHLCGDRIVIAAKGFDPAYGRLHIGKVLQLRMLEALADDPAVKLLDFGFGDAEYKQKLATQTWEDTDVLVYGRSPRAIVAAVGRAAILGADRLARRAAGADRIARVKRRWRDRRTPEA